MERSEEDLEAFLREHGIASDKGSLIYALHQRGWSVTYSQGTLGGWAVHIEPTDLGRNDINRVNADKIDERLGIMKALVQLIEQQGSAANSSQPSLGQS